MKSRKNIKEGKKERINMLTSIEKKKGTKGGEKRKRSMWQKLLCHVFLSYLYMYNSQRQMLLCA